MSMASKLRDIARNTFNKASEDDDQYVSTPTVISILLDESSSMSPYQMPTIEGLNIYIDTLRSTDKEVDVEMSLINFGGEGIYKPIFVSTRIDRVPYLDQNSYRPQYGTCIAPNALQCINEMETRVAQRGDSPNVVMVIQSDGEDSSPKNEDLKKKIAQKRKEGWLFLFMSCGCRADYAKCVGIDAAMTSTYDGWSTQTAFENLAKNTVKFIHSGSAIDLAYDAAQRKAQGDRY